MNKIICLLLALVLISCSINKSSMVVDGKDITSRYNIKVSRSTSKVSRQGYKMDTTCLPLLIKHNNCNIIIQNR